MNEISDSLPSFVDKCFQYKMNLIVIALYTTIFGLDLGVT